MGLQSNCQTTSTEERVRVTINQQGDTLVEMSYNDAKTLLEDVLHYEYADSLLTSFRKKDSLSTEKILLQQRQIENLTQKNLNLEEMVNNFNGILTNKDEEIKLKDETIKQQKKEIHNDRRNTLSPPHTNRQSHSEQLEPNGVK